MSAHFSLFSKLVFLKYRYFPYFLNLRPTITVRNAAAATPAIFLISLQYSRLFCLHESQSFSASSFFSQPHFWQVFHNFSAIASLHHQYFSNIISKKQYSPLKIRQIAPRMLKSYYKNNSITY